MRVTRSSVTRVCAICERTLLMGEHALRFSPDGREYVDVCPLCHDVALEHGWVREGSPTSLTVPAGAAPRPAQPRGAARRRARAGRRGAGGRRADPAAPLRAGARDRRGRRLFNASAYRRTIAGRRAEPRRPAGVDRAALRRQPRDRGHGRLGDLAGTSTASRRTRPSRCGSPSAATTSPSSTRTFTEWNARLADDGRLMPDIARL